MRNACFSYSRPLILELKNLSEFVFLLQDDFLDTLFVDVYVDFIRWWQIWGPLQNPVGAKIEPQIDQVAPNIFFSSSVGRLFPVLMWSYILVALWLSFGTVLGPIGYLLLHFWYQFQWFFMFLAPTFEPNIAKHAPHPPIKLM